MCNNDVLTEFFIWEEKNLTGCNQNLMPSVENAKNDTTIVTKKDLTKNDLNDTTAVKKCSKCGIFKAVTEYYKDRKGKNGITCQCKICINDQQKKYNKNNKEKIKIYKKNYDNKNKEKIKLQKAQYYIENKEKINNRISEYINKPETKIKRRCQRLKYEKDKRKNDIQYNIGQNLRGRLRRSLNGDCKSGSAVKDLGCSIPELKLHLESKFANGMSWNNYGEWHIDHIKPLSKFDLTDRQQLLEACHYTNLQPLWAKDNIRKGNRI